MLKKCMCMLMKPVGKKGIYKVEPEVIEIAKLHSKFFIKRYAQAREGR